MSEIREGRNRGPISGTLSRLKQLPPGKSRVIDGESTGARSRGHTWDPWYHSVYPCKQGTEVLECQAGKCKLMS